MPAAYPSESIEMREVWNDNLEDEFELIRRVVDEYPYVAMDTEFPGIVIRPLIKHKSDDKEFLFQSLKANVDASKLTQLGLTFSDADGNLPTCGTDKHYVWQFNFREFDPETERFSEESIHLLRESGIDFEKNGEEGVDSSRFGELLISSGVVMNEEVRWITFHSAYDFGYLVKVLTGKNLPDTGVEFLDLIKMYFPVVYDVKYMMRSCTGLHVGLNKIATRESVSLIKLVPIVWSLVVHS